MKRVKIYDNVIEIKAKKGKDSNFPNNKFKHSFSSKSKVEVYGNPDGSLTLKSKNGKRLWKRFKYD